MAPHDKQSMDLLRATAATLSRANCVPPSTIPDGAAGRSLSSLALAWLLPSDDRANLIYAGNIKDVATAKTEGACHEKSSSWLR